ncbi:S8 family serine peptidase [Streptomyces sp. NPDC088261]|uniref:S8 family serine peptidase n=1 Tax=Streptomyces sp. NPDC088261 TaxID=3365851 RepID=UPI00382B9675
MARAGWKRTSVAGAVLVVTAGVCAQTAGADTQSGAPWGLARISHTETLSFRTYNKYLHKDEGGSFLNVYVLDTGIRTTHQDFEGRASEWTSQFWGLEGDGSGRGTHMAGTVAGAKYGVAKKVRPVGVMTAGSNGDQHTDLIIESLEQIRDPSRRTEDKYGAVVLIGPGAKRSAELSRAIDATMKAGYLVVTAAGDDSTEDCAFPNSALNVAASTVKDEAADFSNHGKCIDVYGPGVNILSDSATSDTSLNTTSGTGEAAAHAAGVAAYLMYLGKAPLHDAAKAKQTVIDLATKNALTGVPAGTPNRLLYNGGDK